jgi:hypothetical protein
MDSRYWVRSRVHMLGIWANVNMYRLVWINTKSSIEHLFVFCSTQSKSAFWFLVYIQLSESFNNLSCICTFILCIQNLGCKAFKQIFTKELVFNLNVEHVLAAIKLLAQYAYCTVQYAYSNFFVQFGFRVYILCI